MKKKIGIASAVIVLLLLVAVAAVCIIEAPLLKNAGILNKINNIKSFSFNAVVDIDREALDEKQQKFIENFSGVIGVPKEEMCAVRAKGRCFEGQIYADIYLGSMDEALTNVYIVDDEVYMNIRMLYERIKGNLTEKYVLLSLLMPDWGYNDYITLEQVEQIFDVDIRGMVSVDLPKIKSKNSFIEYFAFLFSLEHVEDETGALVFKVPHEVYNILFYLDDDDIFTKAKINGVSEKELQTVRSFNAEVSFNKPISVEAPASIMQQEAVDGFTELWKLINKYFGSES